VVFLRPPPCKLQDITKIRVLWDVTLFRMVFSSAFALLGSYIEWTGVYWRPSLFWNITLCRQIFSNGLRSSGMLSCVDGCLEAPSLFWHITSCKLVAAQIPRKTKSSSTRWRKPWISCGAFQTWFRRMTLNLLLSIRRLFGLEYEASTLLTFLTVCQSTWNDIPKYLNFYQNCCEIIKYRTIILSLIRQ
jgi:hypothetical protein